VSHVSRAHPSANAIKGRLKDDESKTLRDLAKRHDLSPPGFTADKFLRDLPLELNVMAMMLCHGYLSENPGACPPEREPFRRLAEGDIVRIVVANHMKT
jgi:hypothetical protein